MPDGLATGRHRLGPRQRELLAGWRRTVQANPQGIAYDFTAPDPRTELETSLDAFVVEPTKETFAGVWEHLERTTTPYGYVIGQWEGPIDDLAEFLDEVRAAHQWDSAWATTLTSPTWLYELFTRTHDDYPVIDTFTQEYLRRFGIRTERDFESQLEGIERFRAAYEATVGHVTAGLDYEVPVTRELDELFALIHQFPREEIPPRLLGRENPVYEPLIGFEGTTANGGRIELDIDLVERAIDAYATGVAAGAYRDDSDLPDDDRSEYWCGTYDEYWKHQAADAVSATLHGELDGKRLDATDVDRVIETYDEGHGVISQAVIEYLLGPQHGWRVWDAFKESTRENPAVAATVLSRLFDPEADYVTGRLELFRWYYEDDDSLRAGSLMKLASGLLMLAWPERYVLYQYGRCNAFFGGVATSGFEVQTGYNPDQYHRINAAAHRIRDRLDERLDRDATLCDVQSIFYFWADERSYDSWSATRWLGRTLRLPSRSRSDTGIATQTIARRRVKPPVCNDKRADVRTPASTDGSGFA